MKNGVRKVFSTIKEDFGVKIKPQRHREHTNRVKQHRMLWIYRFERNRKVFGLTQKSQSEVRKVFSTISKPPGGRMKLQRQSETRIVYQNNDCKIWSIGVMVTYLLAMQKPPVRIRYVPPEKYGALV